MSMVKPRYLADDKKKGEGEREGRRRSEGRGREAEGRGGEGREGRKFVVVFFKRLFASSSNSQGLPVD